MSISLDKSFAVPAAALQLRAQRTQVLAENLANSDTPGFKARDIDFKAAMVQAKSQLPLMRATHARHLQPAGGDPLKPELLYRTPNAASLDGNTVESHVEQATFAENSVNYQAALTILGSRITGMIGALKREG